MGASAPTHPPTDQPRPTPTPPPPKRGDRISQAMVCGGHMVNNPSDKLILADCIPPPDYDPITDCPPPGKRYRARLGDVRCHVPVVPAEVGFMSAGRYCGPVPVAPPNRWSPFHAWRAIGDWISRQGVLRWES